MLITKITRRALVRDLTASRFWWSGELNEVEFLQRLFDLEALPSYDSRHKTAEEDIARHCIANEDWDSDWIFTDDRFDLMDAEDEGFLEFLVETLHPELRSDPDEAQSLADLYNEHLNMDGYELFQSGAISGRPVYGWRKAIRPNITRSELRDKIADVIAENLKAYDIAEYCEIQLGLEGPYDENDDPFRSKRWYIKARLGNHNDGELLETASNVLHSYGDGDLRRMVDRFLAVDPSLSTHTPLKQLIFAADGPKPEIVLSDAIGNEITITKNEEYCLVFDQAVGPAGISWRKLVSWWKLQHEDDCDEREAGLQLYRRLCRSLSDVESFILTEYARLYREIGFHIPALIPQVYLHYDPYTRRQRSTPNPLARQRMDFLMLFPRDHRVVIELDGKQHYTNTQTDRPDPKKYAELVAEDRELQLQGYRVFRIGGYEMVDQNAGTILLRDFFVSLLEFYDIDVGMRATR